MTISLHVRETGHVTGRRAIPYPLDVCVDCLSVLANGAESPGEERSARAMHERHEGLGAWGEGWLISLGHLTDQCEHCAWTRQEDPELDCTDAFSWAQCDGCGSNAGGARYPATLWEAV